MDFICYALKQIFFVHETYTLEMLLLFSATVMTVLSSPCTHSINFPFHFSFSTTTNFASVSALLQKLTKAEFLIFPPTLENQTYNVLLFFSGLIVNAVAILTLSCLFLASLLCWISPSHHEKFVLMKSSSSIYFLLNFCIASISFCSNSLPLLVSATFRGLETSRVLWILF